MFIKADQQQSYLSGYCRKSISLRRLIQLPVSLPVILLSIINSCTAQPLRLKDTTQPGQHIEWLTGTTDTSYNSLSDYKKNLKHYPFIELVPDSSFKNVIEKRNLVYATANQRNLHIDAFLPQPKKTSALKKTPAILIIHGGGWRSGSPSQHIPLAQHLAARGYACFTVQYRLSTEAFFPAAIYDLKAAIRWLRAQNRQFNIDTNKISVMGFSAGGELAAFIGMTNGIQKFEGDEGNEGHSSRVNAVLDIDGTLSFVHPEASETQHPDKIGASAWWLGYPRTERLDLWKAASPLTYANNNSVPFLFLNSSLARMHAGRDDFKKLMDQQKVKVKIIEFPNTPHSFCLYRPWFPDVVNAVNTFLNDLYSDK
ncbi:pectinesterase [Arachidicoccus rhizosphaerae]|uniref:Pectinesterase n=1 Tax=Arachidicoccus rhizosphaerae TaxID=551991 RepID=A0A1H4A324_9BACT|nr:alpha/beta hydrolase [Arachidicoccus rhizosphaerae]SEA30553.1 pectinesterase [Arachidicoccus rhizosphaerae]